MPTSLQSIHALIIDMDGVLWRGQQPLPGIAPFFNFLRRNGIHFLLATNNATRTVESIVERLRELDVAINPDQVLTSSTSTARWLVHELPRGSRVFVIGEEALRSALQAVGFQVDERLDRNGSEPPPAAVVVGLDRELSYAKLRQGTADIRAGARFIATNNDATFPMEDHLVPGCGAIVAALQTASSVAPTVVGKPYRPMFDAAVELLGSQREETAMLGDRLDTDIEGGRQAGLQTILVLTGVTSPAEAASSPIMPDSTFAGLPELTAAWTAALTIKNH